MDLNSALVHLAINHFPVMGAIGAALIMLGGLIRRSADVQKVALATMLIVGLMAYPTYLSGHQAEERVEHMAGVDKAALEAHEELGTTGLYVGLALGLIGLAGLVISRGKSVPVAMSIVALAASLLASGYMGYVAHSGGLIRHPEISGAPPTLGETHESEEGEHE